MRPRGMGRRRVTQPSATAGRLPRVTPALPALPTRLQVEPTNRCRLRCASCARHHWDAAANAPGDMGHATLERLGPLLDAATELTIGGYGDPTEAPLLLPLVRLASRAGCTVRMITGGSALTPGLLQDLAEAGLDRLVLSMDGATDATLRALRGIPLRSWLAWIRHARRLREEGDGVRPTVEIGLVLQRGNLGELRALVELCAREGVAGIQAFNIKSYAPALDDRCLLGDAEAARPAFEEAAALARDIGVALSLPPLLPPPVACRQPFEMLFVRHDGEVRGCCSAVFSPPVLGLVAGRIEEDPRDLWNAPALRSFRRAAVAWERGEDVTQIAWPEPCRACAFRLPTLAAHLRHLPIRAEGGHDAA